MPLNLCKGKRINKKNKFNISKNRLKADTIKFLTMPSICRQDKINIAKPKIIKNKNKIKNFVNPEY